MERIKFETLAELQETYPVGSVIHEEIETYTTTEYYYNKRDFNYLKTIFEFVEPIDDVSCFCRGTHRTLQLVEGYLYDGEYWRPARNSWDGWLPYDEDDFR